MQTLASMLELTFFVLLFGLIFIGYRLNKSLKFSVNF